MNIPHYSQNLSLDERKPKFVEDECFFFSGRELNFHANFFLLFWLLFWLLFFSSFFSSFLRVIQCLFRKQNIEGKNVSLFRTAKRESHGGILFKFAKKKKDYVDIIRLLSATLSSITFQIDLFLITLG